MMPTVSSLVAPEVIVMTNSGAISDDKVGIMTTLNFDTSDIKVGIMTTGSHCRFVKYNIQMQCIKVP